MKHETKTLSTLSSQADSRIQSSQKRDLWKELEVEVDKIPGGRRYLEKIRLSYSQSGPNGEVICSLNDGPAFESLKAMIISTVRHMASSARQNHENERKKIREQEFWLSVYEETGLDIDEGNLEFNPVTLSIYKNVKGEKEPSGSYKTTIDYYIKLIDHALSNPLAAGQMAHDIYLPSWLQSMARVIVSDNFAPKLRNLIESCIENPSLAKRLQPICSELEMPHWFGDLIKVLGSRKRWEI